VCVSDVYLDWSKLADFIQELLCVDILNVTRLFVLVKCNLK